MKREKAAIEKKIGGMLDRIIQAESRTVIARYESEVEKLELENWFWTRKRLLAAR